MMVQRKNIYLTNKALMNLHNPSPPKRTLWILCYIDD
uniref:Uncharacterized protein n=1 Tax=Arundo donax TaxID=35708 RepID=A0A0A8ZVX6_ARUDO